MSHFRQIDLNLEDTFQYIKWLQDNPHAVSELDDEAFEYMEFISLENLNLGF